MRIRPISKNFFGFTFENEYNAAVAILIEHLKKEIPTVARKYFPDAREWQIHIDHLPTFEKILINYIRNLLQSQSELPF